MVLISGRRSALQLSHEGLLTDLRLDAFLAEHFLKPSVFGFKLLQTFDHGRVHAAKLSSPLIDRARADVVFASNIGVRHPGFVLLRDRHNLAVG